MTNETTNLAESWMHIRMKFDGGKVIHRSQSGSWEHRCMGAGLRQNLGKAWGPLAWQQMTHYPPNEVFVDSAKHSAKRLCADKKRKATEKVRKKRRMSKYNKSQDSTAARKAYSRHDGGIAPDDIAEDISVESLEQLKSSFYQARVIVSHEQAIEVESRTRGQADSEEWAVERRVRITASRVGGICKMREKTKRSNKVREMLYSTFRGTQATRYGSLMEATVKNQYISYKERGGCNVTVSGGGLIISSNNNWLAASPDGIVHDPSNSDQPSGILEIKCPFAARNKSIAEACSTSTFCLELDSDNHLRLKRKHDYYYQVQCQMYCADKVWCDFVVHTTGDLHVERIYRDQKWWGIQLAKLRKIYFSALLPELAVPRYRKGGIREPN